MRFYFYKYLCTTLFSLAISLVNINAQKTEAHENYLNEKIYLHTDQSFYVCGEIMWFKAYVINAVNNFPVGVSKVGYVDVFNSVNQPVLQTSIRLEGGLGNGSFLLPFSLPSGNYVIRAYTNLMKNFSSGNFFTKQITIINTTAPSNETPTSKQEDTHVDFFPEGGNLVNNLQSVVGFKITDNQNKGVGARGVIVDQMNDTVALFKTTKFGMGNFKMTPGEGREYSAIVTFANGISITKKLPKPLTSGFVMNLDDANARDLEIAVTTSKTDKNLSEIFFLFQNNDQINFIKSQRIQSGKAILVVNRDSLREGITQITILDDYKNPVAERLFFKRPKTQMSIKFNADKGVYSFRDMVTIDVNTAGTLGHALSGNLSVAVFKLDSLHQPDEDNIVSHRWLSAALRGYIENPNYYFENDNEEGRESLNNLLMTQGWRKFDQPSKNAGTLLKYPPEFSDHIITGKVTNKTNGQPVAGVRTYLSVPGKRVHLRTCISDSLGFIRFEMKDFYGRNQVVLQTDNENSLDSYNIEILSPYATNDFQGELPEFKYPYSMKGDLVSANFDMGVQSMYHHSELEKVRDVDIDSLPFFYKPDHSYMLSNYTRFTTMEEVMREYVTEVNVRKKGSQYRFATINLPGFALRDFQPTENIFENNPLVLLDGVPVFDINKIVAYDPLKVEKLDVVAQRYFMGTLTADGIVSYTTYSGKLDGFTLDPRDLVLDYEGLQKSRVFYSPEYSTPHEREGRLPDFRRLLFWSPGIETDMNGKSGFSFYTGDNAGKYVIIIQGLSADGTPGYSQINFEVKK